MVTCAVVERLWLVWHVACYASSVGLGWFVLWSGWIGLVCVVEWSGVEWFESVAVGCRWLGLLCECGSQLLRVFCSAEAVLFVFRLGLGAVPWFRLRGVGVIRCVAVAIIVAWFWLVVACFGRGVACFACFAASVGFASSSAAWFVWVGVRCHGASSLVSAWSVSIGGIVCCLLCGSKRQDVEQN